jgi:hypothetical protein
MQSQPGAQLLLVEQEAGSHLPTGSAQTQMSPDKQSESRWQP